MAISTTSSSTNTPVTSDAASEITLVDNTASPSDKGTSSKGPKSLKATLKDELRKLRDDGSTHNGHKADPNRNWEARYYGRA